MKIWTIENPRVSNVVAEVTLAGRRYQRTQRGTWVDEYGVSVSEVEQRLLEEAARRQGISLPASPLGPASRNMSITRATRSPQSFGTRQADGHLFLDPRGGALNRLDWQLRHLFQGVSCLGYCFTDRIDDAWSRRLRSAKSSTLAQTKALRLLADVVCASWAPGAGRTVIVSVIPSKERTLPKAGLLWNLGKRLSKQLGWRWCPLALSKNPHAALHYARSLEM